MAKESAISWTDATFNPWIGCTQVGLGCDNCYAATLMDSRMGRVRWGAGQPRSRTSVSNWRQPRRWNKEAFFECSGCGWRGSEKDYAKLVKPPAKACCPDHALVPARRRVFCASLADVFDNEVDPQWRSDLFSLISETPSLDWMVLTKRIGNVAEMTRGIKLPPNMLLGITVVNQDEANRDIPKLRSIPDVRRFLSMEPLIGEVDLAHNDKLTSRDRYPIHWVIVGGETGAHARSMVLGWAKRIVRDCLNAGVAVHVKQLGRYPRNREGDRHPISDEKGKLMNEWPEILRIRQFPPGSV